MKIVEKNCHATISQESYQKRQKLDFIEDHFTIGKSNLESETQAEAQSVSNWT